jgi:hypothetical protein
VSTRPEHLLEIYLEDHRAGASGGVALAQRVAERCGTTAGFESLTALASEIRQDQRSLDAIVREVGATGGAIKRLAAVVGERLGRLKLNGAFIRPSPLSLVLELEALTAGVVAKQRGWVALRIYAQGDEFAGVDLAGLEARAARQLDQLQQLHARAAELALGPDAAATN